MNKEFIPYEQALELKELGFDEPCMAFYEPGNKEVKVVGVNQRYNDPSLLTVTDFCAPLYQQAFRWFREKHDLFGCIDLQACVPSHWFIRIDKIEINDYLYHSEDKNIQYSTYEEAELACLKKLIETLQARDKVGKWFADNADITIEMNKNERK
jgi:hypothetical protein